MSVFVIEHKYVNNDKWERAVTNCMYKARKRFIKVMGDMQQWIGTHSYQQYSYVGEVRICTAIPKYPYKTREVLEYKKI